jgi:hypothetical protein
MSIAVGSAMGALGIEALMVDLNVFEEQLWDKGRLFLHVIYFIVRFYSSLLIKLDFVC